MGFVRPKATAGARPSLTACAPQGLSFSSLQRSETTCGALFFLSYAMPTSSATALVPPAHCSAVALPWGLAAGWEHPQPDAAWGQGQLLPCGTCVWCLSMVSACPPHTCPSVMGTASSFRICLADASWLASCLEVCSPHAAANL